MKLFHLTYNELIKQWKKTSIKLMFVIILLSAMLLPLVANQIAGETSKQVVLDNNEFLLEHAKNEVETLKQDQTDKGKIRYELSLSEVDYRQLLIDYKIGLEDWRGVLAEHLKDVQTELSALGLVKKGYQRELLLEHLTGVEPDKVKAFYDMTPEEVNGVEQELLAKIENYKNIIATGDHEAYIKVAMAINEEDINNLEAHIQLYEELKAKNQLDEAEKKELERLGKRLDEAKATLIHREQDADILQFRLDEKIDYDKNNWKNNAIVTLEKELQPFRMPILPENEYNVYGSQAGYTMVYEDYVKNEAKLNKKRGEKIKKIGYALEHDIPSLTDRLDARSVVNDTYEIYVMVAVIMAIIIGGGIVATEFSKGTIRLLLIRPVSRWKVLLSKLLAVLVMGFAVLALGVGMLALSAGMKYGFETYNMPVLKLVGEQVVEVHFFSYLIPRLLVSSASLVFITAFVFTLSTVAKNTALAVALSMIAYLATPPLVDALLNMNQTWVVQTFVPYINSSYFRLLTRTTETLASQSGVYMQYESGALQLLVLSILCMMIAFRVFTKKDIQN